MRENQSIHTKYLVREYTKKISDNEIETRQLKEGLSPLQYLNYQKKLICL